MFQGNCPKCKKSIPDAYYKNECPFCGAILSPGIISTNSGTESNVKNVTTVEWHPLIDLTTTIKDRTLRQMTDHFLTKYKDQIQTIPPSLSGFHHGKEATTEDHLRRTFWFAQKCAEEFNLSPDDRDILLTCALLHDLGNYEYISKERNPAEFQTLYPTGFNRSREAYYYHPVLSTFMIGKYMLELPTHEVNNKICKVAMTVASHMSHWFAGFNNPCPLPKTEIERLLALSDYFASRDEIVIEE